MGNKRTNLSLFFVGLFSASLFIGPVDAQAQCKNDRINSLLASPDRVGF